MRWDSLRDLRPESRNRRPRGENHRALDGSHVVWRQSQSGGGTHDEPMPGHHGPRCAVDAVDMEAPHSVSTAGRRRMALKPERDLPRTPGARAQSPPASRSWTYRPSWSATRSASPRSTPPPPWPEPSVSTPGTPAPTTKHTPSSAKPWPAAATSTPKTAPWLSGSTPYQHSVLPPPSRSCVNTSPAPKPAIPEPTSSCATRSKPAQREWPHTKYHSMSRALVVRVRDRSRWSHWIRSAALCVRVVDLDEVHRGELPRGRLDFACDRGRGTAGVAPCGQPNPPPLPTVRTSCPGSKTNTSPGPMVSSVPSSEWTLIRADRQILVCRSGHDPVPTIGLTSLDHAQSGWQVSLPSVKVPSVTTSTWALACDFRVSSALSMLCVWSWAITGLLRGTWVGCRFSCGRCSSGLE